MCDKVQAQCRSCCELSLFHSVANILRLQGGTGLEATGVAEAQLRRTGGWQRRGRKERSGEGWDQLESWVRRGVMQKLWALSEA